MNDNYNGLKQCLNKHFKCMNAFVYGHSLLTLFAVIDGLHLALEEIDK